MARTKEEILKDWLQALEDDIRANYQKLGLKASGEFGRTLRNFIVKDQSKLVGQIIGKDYAEFMENVRIFVFYQFLQLLQSKVDILD